MSFQTSDCTTNAGNTGAQNCKNSLRRDERIWLVPPGTEVATKTLAETESTWDDLFNAAKGVRGYPIPAIFSAEFEQGEDTYEEGWDNKQEFASEGLDTVTYLLEKTSLYNSAQLRTLNGVSWSVFRIPADGKTIVGWSDDGVIFKPEDILSIRFGKRTYADGTVSERIPVKITFKDPAQRNDFPATVETSWNTLELDGIKDLQVSASNPLITAVTVTLTGFDGVPHIIAVEADFVVYDDAGVVVPHTMAAVGNGVYTITATMPAGEYTVGLKNQPDATTPYFETPTLASFTTV